MPKKCLRQEKTYEEGQELRGACLKYFFFLIEHAFGVLEYNLQVLHLLQCFFQSKLHLTRFGYQQLIKPKVANYVHSPLKTSKAFAAEVY